MKLNKQQRARLKTLWYFYSCANPPTRINLLKRVALQMFVLLLILVGFGFLAYMTSPNNEFLLLATGALGGSIYTATISIMASRRIWPLTKEITNWSRVEELREENQITD
ncbi:MAG: hypothetical protein AAGH99_14735 [Planctomycetota bacterium]